jgi:hypothetical protein
LWRSVFHGAVARTQFGVLSQNQAIGIESHCVPAVTMMTADNYLGAVTYGYDSRFIIHASSVTGYRNPFLDELESLFRDTPLFERAAVNCAYDIAPQIFATVHGTRFAATRPGVLAPVSTSVTLAIGVVSRGKVIADIPYQCGRGAMIETQFPFVWAAFNRLKHAFAQYAAAEPSLLRTIGYAETVLLLRRACADGAKRPGELRIEEHFRSRERITHPRFDYSTRAARFAELNRMMAERLSAHARASHWQYFMAMLVGCRCARFAGDSVSFAACRRRVLEFMKASKREPYGRPSLTHALQERFSAIENGLNAGSHDLILDLCFRLGTTVGTVGADGYLRDVIRLCDATTDFNVNVNIRCLRSQAQAALAHSHDPVPDLARTRKQHPADLRPYTTLVSISQRRLARRIADQESCTPELATTPLGLDSIHCWRSSRLLPTSKLLGDVVTFAAIDEAEIVKRAIECAILWRSLRELISPVEFSRLSYDLVRFDVPLDEFVRRMRKSAAGSFTVVLAQLMFEKLNRNSLEFFSAQYLHHDNPFALCHELIAPSEIDLLRTVPSLSDLSLTTIDEWPSYSSPLWKSLSQLRPWSKTAARVWDEVVRIHSPSQHTQPSKAMFLLRHELHARRRRVYDLAAAMSENRIANPQAGLFWLDSHPNFHQTPSIS